VRLIDTHCHLDTTRFDADRDAVIARAFAQGVAGIVVPAIGPDAWEALLRLPASDARLQVGVGIHPQLLPELPEAEDERHLEVLDGLLARGQAVAVGECGLDGPSAARAPMERQARVFRAHLRLARKHGLPVLVHCHRAHPALLEVLRDTPLPDRGLLLHSYSGGPELVKKYLAHGCWFSFAGPVTWPEARKPLQALRAVPLDRLLTETDAPDQTPAPHRGQRSEPGYLPLIAEAMARHLGMSAKALAEQTAQNADRLFQGVFGVR
jgi:TatD DNase family protein